MNKYLQLLLAGSISLQLVSCITTTPKPDGENPQASASPMVDLPAPNPENADELYAYAVKLEEMGKDNDALSYYLQATQVNPEHIKAHIALAQLYSKFARKDEAGIAYENILRLDRNHPFVAQFKEARLKYYSAVNIAQNEEYEKALKLLAEAPRGTPMDDEVTAKEKEWKSLMQSGSDVRKSQEVIEQASLLAYQGKYQNAIDLIKTAPDVGSNATITDKLDQWQKALQNQPIVSSSQAPISGNRKIHYILGDDVQIRQSPYLYAETLGSLKNGTPVEVLLDKGYEADGYQWSKVQTDDGKVGWVAANLLSASLNRPSNSNTTSSPKPVNSATPVAPLKSYGTRYVKADQVNIRRSPSANASLVTQANKGAPLVLLSERAIEADGYAWVKVKLTNGNIGWVASQYLRIANNPAVTASAKPSAKPSTSPSSKPSTSPIKAPTVRTAQIIGEDINVRSGPNSTAEVIAQVSAPSKVTLLNAKPVKQGTLSWQQVQLPGGKKGWVATQFLGSASTNTTKPAASTKRYIRGDKVNIRTSPGTGASLLSTATEGTVVTLLSTTPVKKDGHNWYKIRLANGKIGWVSSSFLGS